MKGIHEYCPSCMKDIEEQYEKCYKYLRENRQSTFPELSEATGVSIRQITKFVREGRISLANHPNMSYECEVCGAAIREGAMCDSCRQKLLKDASHVLQDSQKKLEQQKSDLQKSFNIKDRLRERH
ncbi:flagellar protein [Gordoniibacillus kamchatkensis]